VVLPDAELVPGETLGFLVGGFDANADVRITLNSTPRDLGTVVADDDGIVEYEFTVPADLEVGPHSLVFVGDAPGQSQLTTAVVVNGVQTVTFPFVIAADETASPTASNDGTGGGTAGGALPDTGGAPTTALAYGLLLLAAGVALVAAARRRTGLSTGTSTTRTH